MTRKEILKKVALFALCAALTLNAGGALSPAYAAAGTVYTFGDANGSFRDLAAEHQKEVERRKKERRKEERKQAVREKAAMKKAAREARGREQKDKAVKEDAGE